MSEPETVNHPKHYFLNIHGRDREAIDIVEELAGEGVDLGFHLGQAFIYIWRAHRKNGVNDLDKAIWYINRWKENVSLACAKPLVRAANSMARAVVDMREAMTVGVLVDVSDPPGQQRAKMSPGIAEGRTEEWIEEILRSIFSSDMRPQPTPQPDGLDRILDKLAATHQP